MMEAVHATEEWQRAGVHYIRIPDIRQTNI